MFIMPQICDFVHGNVQDDKAVVISNRDCGTIGMFTTSRLKPGA